MEVVKRIKSHQDQFLAYVMDCKAGDVEYIDSPGGDSMIDMPDGLMHVRLSIDSEEVVTFHTENINNHKDKTISLHPHLTLFGRHKDSVDWGLFPDQQHDWKISDFFETQDNNILVPYNRKVEDLRARIGNTKILDSDNYVEDFAHTSRATRPSTVQYWNDCRVVCLTFMPRVDVEWKSGAWIQFGYDGPKRITKKGSSLNYIVTARDTELLDGTRIVAGVAYRMDSPSLEFKSNTNIILHIHD